MGKEAIREELKKVRDDIKELKKEFLKRKSEKEEHFSQGEGFTTKINALYEEVKEIEKKHNLDKINKDLDKRLAELEELKKNFATAGQEMKDHKPEPRARPAIKTVSVDRAKKELKQLDLKLQTQVLSLEKESEISRRIAELKELIDSHSGAAPQTTEASGPRKNFNVLRKKINNSERKVRSLYKQIRLISKEKKAKYKEIDALRDQRKKSFESFRSHKKDYSSLGKDLRELFKKEDELLNELGEAPAQKKRQIDKKIKQKQQEVEDKLLKKGSTLTTEDLLMFQSKK